MTAKVMSLKEELLEARLYAGLTTKEAAALTGRHRTTWCRMECGQTRIDLACLRLLEVLSGDLGVMHPDWTGIRIARDGRLYVPGYARGCSLNDIHRLPWLYQLAALAQAYARSGRPDPSEPRPTQIPSFKRLDETG